MIEKMLEWADKQEDIYQVKFGFTQDSFVVSSWHTDKRYVEGVGESMEDAMKNYSSMYNKVMSVKNKLNE